MKKKALCLLLCALLCLTILPAGAFSDLTGSYLWASEAAQNMVDQNIMTPKSETEFGAADLVGEAELVQILNAAFGGGLAETSNAAPVTRELMCSYIVNAQGLVADETADDEIVYATFRDANQISPEHLESVKIALQNKVITGYEDNTFRPKNFVTKAELASLLNKLVGTSEEAPQKLSAASEKWKF